MTDNNNQPYVNNDLIERQKNWKKTERITLWIDLVLLFIFIVLSTVKQNTGFNSLVFFVLVVIFGVMMLVDLVILIISWCKLYHLNSLISMQENSSDNDNIM